MRAPSVAIAAAAIRPPTQRERVLDMLRTGPKSTLDIHGAYVLAVSNVIFRLRCEGHVIRNTPLPNGVAVYNLEVHEAHTYFVLAPDAAGDVQAVWVHNAGYPGKVMNVNEDFSDIASKYQKQVTGNPRGRAYIVDGVKFDGYRNQVLLDAKGLGYAKLIQDPHIASTLADNLVAQARRQLTAAQRREDAI